MTSVTTVNSDNEAVIRQDFNSMGAAMQKRFIDAVNKMQEPKDGVAGTSVFFDLATIHGFPGQIYCAHNEETFPSWHRIYLLMFEKALQAADIELGNDGKIGLPYWNWTGSDNQGIPSAIRENFGQFRDDLFPANLNGAPNLQRRSNSDIVSLIGANNVAQLTTNSLLNVTHSRFASTNGEFPPFRSIESPHGTIHVIVGRPMGSVEYAAFDVVFWLHHCNIDRILSTYLNMEPDSENEFASSNPTAFNLPFEPRSVFRKENGQPYYPSDTFGDTAALGYTYDTPFPEPQGGALMVQPTMAIFENVKISDFQSKCYQVHVFVMDDKTEEKWTDPQTLSDIDFSSPNYGGGTGIFGRGPECSTCEQAPRFDLMIDISDTLRKLNLSRYNAKLKTYLLNTSYDQPLTNNLIKLTEDFGALPMPHIEGPIFENTNDNLNESNDVSKEVLQLQKYLNQFGNYNGKLDGIFGEKTKKAVELYQEAINVKVDGIVGKNTKYAITHSKRCNNKDSFGQDSDDDNENKNNSDKNDDTVVYGGKKLISYFIEQVPGYLNRKNTVKCIRNAFNLWSIAMDNKIVFYNITDDINNADIVLSWSKTSSFKNKEIVNVLKFDGIGGVLGFGGMSSNEKGYVIFDSSERWVVDNKQVSNVNDPKTWYRGQPKMSLYYTAVHEIGHALGLNHSINPADFMSPFYDPSKEKLSENDIAMVKAKFGLQ